MRLLTTIKRSLWRRNFWIASFVLMLLLNAFFLVSYVSNNRNQLVFNPYIKSVLPLYRSLRQFGNNLINLAYLPAMRRDVGIPQYRLQIKTTDLGELNKNIPNSISNEVISGSVSFGEQLGETVPAVFYADNKEYEVNVRYRGENPNHWIHPKKSWQIKFDKNNDYQGLRTLKLILASDRGYFAELLNNYRAEKLGLVFPRAKLVQLYMNNSYAGVYFGVEDFNSGFLEASGKPVDANIYTNNDTATLDRETQTNYDSIDYWRKETNDSLFEYENFSELDFLLDLMAGNNFGSQAENIIDLESFYNWNIVALLAGSNHQSSWGNMRLYFNNAKGKFEFISWDVGVKNNMPTELTNLLTEKILSVPEFYQERNQKLWEYVSSKDNLDDDLAYYDSLYSQTKGAFYSDFKKHKSNFAFNKKVAEVRNLYQNIFNNLQNLYNKDEAGLQVRHYGDRKLINFNFDIKSFAGLNLKEIELPFTEVNSAAVYTDNNENYIFDDEDLLLASRDNETGKILFTDLNSYLGKGQKSVFVKYSGDIISDISQIKIKLANSITNDKVKVSSPKISDLTSFGSFFEISSTPEQFVARNPLFRLIDNEISLGPGSYIFSNNTIIPSNTKLTINPGTNIYFTSNASLVSYSPVAAMGASDNRISMQSLNQDQKWGSFAVLNTGAQKSDLQYLNVSGGGSAYINGSFLSGMISIYYSDSEINNITVSGSNSDDGLNVKYGEINLSNSIFNNNSADALDLDYAQGEITNSVFNGNGNDGIDLSGSDILIKENKINASGDKCISVGESSTNAVIFNNILTNCNVGVEAKDASAPTIINSVIIGNNIGINVYRKKPIFIDGGAPIVYNSIIRSNNEQIKLDEFSNISVSHSNIEGSYEGDHNFDEAKDVLQINDTSRGDGDAIKQYLDLSVEAVPVGLLNNF